MVSALNRGNVKISVKFTRRMYAQVALFKIMIGGQYLSISLYVFLFTPITVLKFFVIDFLNVKSLL